MAYKAHPGHFEIQFAVWHLFTECWRLMRYVSSCLGNSASSTLEHEQIRCGSVASRFGIPFVDNAQ